MTYLERVYQLEPLLGPHYKYESIHIGEEAESVEEAFNKVEVDLKIFLDREKTAQPVKTEELPF